MPFKDRTNGEVWVEDIVAAASVGYGVRVACAGSLLIANTRGFCHSGSEDESDCTCALESVTQVVIESQMNIRMAKDFHMKAPAIESNHEREILRCEMKHSQETVGQKSN
jgi:hypothetical protein